MSKTKLEKIEFEIKQLRTKLAFLEEQKQEYRSQKFFKCIGSLRHGKGCGKKSRVDKLIGAQIFYYDDEPYSGSWRRSFLYFVCPKCGVLVDVKEEHLLLQHGLKIMSVHEDDNYLLRRDVSSLNNIIKQHYKGIELKYNKNIWRL